MKKPSSMLFLSCINAAEVLVKTFEITNYICAYRDNKNFDFNLEI